MRYKGNQAFIGLLLIFMVSMSCKPTAKVAVESKAETSSPADKANLEKENERMLRIRQKESKIKNYKGSNTRNFDLLHTKLFLSFDYDLKTVNGEAELSLKPYFYEKEILVLDAKEFDIHEVYLMGQGNRQDLSYSYNNKQIEIDLPHKTGAEDTLALHIAYTAFPERGNDIGTAAISDTKGLYFINPDSSESGKPVQIWTQGETEYTSKWYPTIDSPNERQTHDFYLRVPDKYISISNGLLVESKSHKDGTRTDHWKMNQAHAPYLSAIVVGEFASIEGESDSGIPLRYFVEPKYEAGARKVFEHTPEMVTFFSDLLQVPFPWQKYDQVVVRDFVSGAMENTTLSIFMEALNLNEREALDSEWDYIIAHELFHQWFGNYVTTESWANLTLNEAFADYSEYLWFEYKEGRDQADMHHFNAMEEYLDEAEEKQEDLIRYYYSHSDEMFDSHTYAKGGRVLHMLRNFLGDRAFFQGLKRYLLDNASQAVEIHHLRLAMEKVSGMDLNWFFNQWFLSSGHPELSIDWDYSDPDNIILKIKQLQDLADTPLFKIPFSVHIYKQGQAIEKKFVLDQAYQEFVLNNGPGTELALFDEYHTILAEKKTLRGPEFLEKQFHYAHSGLARVEALDSLTSTVKLPEGVEEMIGEALDDPFWVVRELALQRLAGITTGQSELYQIESKVLQMAEFDSSNTVKAAAIEVLAGINPGKYEQLIYRLINDPSYQVSGSALMIFMDMEGNLPKKKAVFERLESEENIRILAPLADYLTQSGQSEHMDWMHEKLAVLEGESLYYFIGYYGDYFASVESVPVEKAISNLGKLGGEHALPYVRLAAFQSLFGFIDDEGVLDLAKALLLSEKDEMVRQYQKYYLEPYLEEE
ncbi:M1 family peptidase [Cyclobacterium sp. GBPx2]|uniref:Aminopeptidase N n=2 Tax=Cyclobacterium plantarum TaxID=2716263 RepID=A0ABX0H7S3_9BACT|nr:M1 family peptidase [Cyclobacterium plantarum]